jgi:cytoskeletal protein RodZ
MPSWVWVLIAIGVVVIVAVIVWQGVGRRRTGKLQEQFGPEYDRTVETADSRREAESELQQREERRRELEIRPLPRDARDRYVAGWQSVQAQFVDEPATAVARADELIQSVMAERGYPVDDFEQRAADVSVDHPQVVENYREGHRLAQSSADGSGSTENLRQAMRHYRALFDDLVGDDADGTTQERASEEPAGDGDRRPSEERTVR